MDDGVHAGGGRHGAGQRQDQFRVQDGLVRNDLRAYDGELEVAGMIGDNRRCRHLAARSRGGGDGHHRHSLAGHLAQSLVVGDRASMGCQHAHRLGHVHGRAAAQGYDTPGSAGGKHIDGLVYGLNRGIGFHLGKNSVGDPTLLQCLGDPPGKPQLDQHGIRHHQHRVKAAVRQQVGQPPYRTGAEGDILHQTK